MLTIGMNSSHRAGVADQLGMEMLSIAVCGHDKQWEAGGILGCRVSGAGRADPRES